MGDFSASQHLHPPFTLPDCVSSARRHRGTPALPQIRGAPGCKPLPARSLKSERWPRLARRTLIMCATLASWVCREVNGLLGSVATGVLVKELCAPNLKLDNVAPFSFRLCVANAGTIMVCLNTSIRWRGGHEPVAVSRAAARKSTRFTPTAKPSSPR